MNQLFLHDAMRPLSIYCDGAAPNNQNGCAKGGVGVAIYDALDCCVYEYSSKVQGVNGTTNQRAELLALICSLLLSSAGDCIYSDSQYSVKGYNEWLSGWKSKGWRSSSRKPIANLDLWLLIDDIQTMRRGVKVVHVSGHNGLAGNEHADRLATEAAHQD